MTSTRNTPRHAHKLVAAQNGKCAVFGDFRKLLEMPGIDAVVVSTPEHWHALPTIAACEAKKDVYCEKPLTLFVAEGRKMVEAARRNSCIVQTGSQQRSDGRFRLACELVASGRLGKIEKVEVGIAEVNDPGPLGPDTDSPKELDYDFWVGPSPYRPYNEKRVHYNFRFWWAFAGGQVTNWGRIISILRNGRSTTIRPARYRSKPPSSIVLATKCSPGAS